MGWDAFATFSKHGFERDRQLEAFKLAVKEINAIGVPADGFLYLGGLDCYRSRLMLVKATGHMLKLIETPAKVVQQMAATANWNFKVAKDDWWAYWSAFYFLETCAALGIGVHFYW